MHDAEVHQKEEELASEDEEKAGCEVLARAAAGGRPCGAPLDAPFRHWA